MLVRKLMIAGGLALLGSGAAFAQDAVVALNPTLMVGNAGVAAAGRHARNGDAQAAQDLARERQSRAICANLNELAKKPRATPEKMQKLAQMCRQLGL